jgi:hypothetical protein
VSQPKQAKIEEAHKDEINDDDRAGSDNEEDEGNAGESEAATAESALKIEGTNITRFLTPSRHPEKALFRDEDGGLVIPQEPLVNVLKVLR